MDSASEAASTIADLTAEIDRLKLENIDLKKDLEEERIFLSTMEADRIRVENEVTNFFEKAEAANQLVETRQSVADALIKSIEVWIFTIYKHL